MGHPLKCPSVELSFNFRGARYTSSLIYCNASSKLVMTHLAQRFDEDVGSRGLDVGRRFDSDAHEGPVKRGMIINLRQLCDNVPAAHPLFNATLSLSIHCTLALAAFHQKRTKEENNRSLAVDGR